MKTIPFHGPGRACLFALSVLTLGPAVNAGDSDRERSEKERLEELERKVEVLTREAERERFGDVFIEVGESRYGMGPSASKVYYKEQGVSIGGYGEGLYEVKSGDTDEADFLRAVLYFGYKYNDRWLFNSEIEFEHASTSTGGSASVEFAYLDYLRSPALNLRTGLLLVPMGIVNELHEPALFLSAKRPETESRIIPSTWRENGIGIFGDLSESIGYKAYVVNGLRGAKFNDSGLRGGRQKGSEALADDLAGALRVDFAPTEGLLASASLYYGDSGQDLDIALSTSIFEAHLDWRRRGLSVRALVAAAWLDDAAELTRINNPVPAGTTPEEHYATVNPVGEKLLGWYVEAGYDAFNPLDTQEASLTPFVRFEQIDTQDQVPSGFKRPSGNRDQQLVTIGINYKPIDELVFKADYVFHDSEDDSAEDQFNLALGYVF